MLYAGSDDGVYRIAGVPGPDETTAERVLEAEDVYRVERYDPLEGLFATAESGLYYSPAGDDWLRLPVPEEQVYAVTVDPAGERVYAGTRPARVFVADWDGPPGADRWTELDGFRALRDRADWGIPRHDDLAQVRSLRTHPGAPDRLVAGVEVGGVHLSDDRGASWVDRSIEGFDAPHTDDIHHIALPDPGTLVASTGSGLYRSEDAGRTWTRLDTGHRQRYFREASVHDGAVYAGAAPASSSSWEEDRDHALLVSRERGGEGLQQVDTPTPEEVPLGWCVVEGDPVTATHRGTLLRRDDGEWERAGSVPTPGAVRGRYMPLCWVES
ncbi:WD40/YVTN/BNR-like repeat-containing protein [Salinirussus salinus]|uniref:WD40/YVTN/BNR-like repeat-containing protein n=1 Tax=Salinirussus salinus TaxID=1198300 RepID=UPI0013572594|nr:WD40 repeat domain-containing protein [Salinirussus salinus]